MRLTGKQIKPEVNADHPDGSHHFRLDRSSILLLCVVVSSKRNCGHSNRGWTAPLRDGRTPLLTIRQCIRKPALRVQNYHDAQLELKCPISAKNAADRCPRDLSPSGFWRANVTRPAARKTNRKKSCDRFASDAANRLVPAARALLRNGFSEAVAVARQSRRQSHCR